MAKRFLTPDSYFFEQAEEIEESPLEGNLYSYSKNSPINNLDKTGDKSYGAARDLNGVFVGTHQFTILVPDNPEHFNEAVMSKYGAPKLQDLGGGKLGVVVGAHNVDGTLQVKFNETADLQAAKEYFGGAKTSPLKSDFSTQVEKIEHKGLSDSKFIGNVLENASNFGKNSKSNPISYPNILKNAAGAVNSNSFNQSLQEVSGASNKVQNFNGLDRGNNLRVPESSFKSN